MRRPSFKGWTRVRLYRGRQLHFVPSYDVHDLTACLEDATQAIENSPDLVRWPDCAKCMAALREQGVER